MKKVFALFLAVAMLSVSVSAEPQVKDMFFESTYNASGSTEATIGTNTGDMAAKTGRRIAIWSIMAQSDLSTSVIKIYEGDTTGSTTNYSVVATYDLGDASALLDPNTPIHIGETNVQLKVGVTSTTANSLSVGWTYDQ